MAKKWIQKASKSRRKGALHRQLGIPQDQKIPKSKLRKIVSTPIGRKACGKTVSRLLKRRALFALNVQKKR